MEKYNFCIICTNKKPTNTSTICRGCHINKIKEQRKKILFMKCEGCGKEKTNPDSDQRYKLCFDCSRKQIKQNSKKTDICSKCGKQKKYTYNILCKSCALSGIKPSQETKNLWSIQRKGKSPPNKGKKGKSTLHTLESKTKISNSKTGLNLTPEQYLDYVSKQIDEGRREKLGKNLESKKWSLLVKQKYNFKCAICESTNKLHSHHIKSWRKFPEYRFDIENGICLCQKCHILEHKREKNENSPFV